MNQLRHVKFKKNVLRRYLIMNFQFKDTPKKMSLLSVYFPLIETFFDDNRIKEWFTIKVAYIIELTNNNRLRSLK
jgi:hypothetical protein